jgi:gliding motility-associated-like protein
MNMNKFTGLIIAGAILSLGASKVYAQSCDYISQANDIMPDKLCAPVNATWEITYRGVQDGGTGDVNIYLDWGDDSPVEIITATEYAAGNWEVITTHTYPEGGDQCNYRVEAMLMVAGTLCTSSAQTQLITVWDTDDENGGNIVISPNIFPICVGSDGTVQFTDASQWNCTPPYEEDSPNNRNRWTQWIYGTGSTNITTAEANGTTFSWPDSGAIEYYPSIVTDPSPPNSQSKTIYIPPGYNIGDYFEVTIRNWNTCNPYDDPNIPGDPADPVNGDNDPVETTAMALIVPVPDGSVNNAGPFCETDPPVTLSPATSGGTWSGPGVNPTSGVFTPLDAGTGVHTIQYNITDSNGCSASGSVDIEVRETPDVTILPGTALNLCPGLDLQLTANITGGLAPYSINWTGDTTPLDDTTIETPQFTTPIIGTYNVIATVTDANGCTNETNITIVVEDVSINLDANTLEACRGVVTELNPNVTGGSTNYISHEWTGPDTDKLSATDVSNPDFLSGETGTFNFTYMVTDDMGCSDQTDIAVLVKEQPLAMAGENDSVCSLQYQLNGNQDGVSTGLWEEVSVAGTISFNDAGLPDATATVDTHGSYELMWTLDNDGCVHSDTIEILFAETPSPLTGDDFEICGDSASLEAIPDMAAGQWTKVSGPGNINFSDDIDPLTEVTADLSGTYAFAWTEISPAGCSAEVFQTVDFLPQASAQIVSFANVGCTPYEITFNNISENADSYQWSFGDGGASSAQHPMHVFESHDNTPDTFLISLYANNAYSCNDELSFDVIVNPIPNAAFEPSDKEGCSPLSVDFNNTSTGASNYTWDFDDTTPASSDQNPSHTFINAEDFVQSYNIDLTAENIYGCADHHNTYISVYPVRDIDLTADPIEGCSPLTTQLTADRGAKEYLWDFGDGTQTPGNYSTSHVFENNTSSDIEFEVIVEGTSPFGCLEEAYAKVLVHPSPQTAFEATPTEQQMPNRTVSFNNLTPGEWDYLWNFGDETSSSSKNPPPHEYAESGKYEVVLQAFSNDCEASATKTISIIPMIPAIDYGQNQSGCPPLSVNFFNNTLDATTYLWAFGDGNTSLQDAPTHTYHTSGTYQVKLTAQGPGGVATANDVTIEVYDNPVALFEPVPKVVYIPGDEVSFVNRSEGGSSYIWYFGDNSTSTNFSPNHLYIQTGTYDVTLQVENDEGCTDERTILNAVKAEQGGEIELPNAFTPSKSGPTDGQYTFGERTNHVFYPFVQKGIVEYKLQIFSRWGELIFESNDVTQGWNGYYRDEICPQGVYIWRVTATYSNGKRIEKTGDVTLLR